MMKNKKGSVGIYNGFDQKKKWLKIGGVLLVILLLAGGFFIFNKKKAAVKQININGSQPQQGPQNQGNVSPISGLACADWNRRPFAVMQPADVSARPDSGFSDADMVFEMPVITNSITRLMGVYICGNPEDVGSMRSARPDFVALAKGIDAIFVHWGRADIDIFKNALNSGVIDDMNCNDDAGKSASKYCYRKQATGNMVGTDTGYAKFAQLLQGAQDFGYKMTDDFVGYPHQADAPLDQRPAGGRLRVVFAKPYDAEYDYDKASNSYLRSWNNVPDTDRNNGQRIAPKNVVVLTAESSQLIEGQQYNEVQIGDPWYSTTDSGVAHYYMNGQEIVGTWKKDKSSLDSKLFFYDASGQEIKFVPGQIWVDILEPDQDLQWIPSTTSTASPTTTTTTPASTAPANTPSSPAPTN